MSNKAIESCPICDGPMEQVTEEREFRIGSRSAEVLDEFLRCGDCGEELYTPAQLASTQTRAAEAIRLQEGLLLPAEIKALRQHLGLTQRQLEVLIRAGEKTVVRWERGTVFQNAMTDELLRIIRRFPQVAQYLADRRGLTLAGSASWHFHWGSAPTEVAAVAATGHAPGESSDTSWAFEFPPGGGVATNLRASHA